MEPGQLVERPIEIEQFLERGHRAIALVQLAEAHALPIATAFSPPARPRMFHQGG